MPAAPPYQARLIGYLDGWRGIGPLAPGWAPGVASAASAVHLRIAQAVTSRPCGGPYSYEPLHGHS